MRRYAAPVGLAVLLLLLGFPALDCYNVTWDEALGDFFFGERYLSFFATLDVAYLDFESDPYPAQRTPDLSVSPFRDRPWEYYPAANLLAAASCALLYRALGLLDPFDAFHASNLGLGAILVAVLYVWMRRRFDPLAAFVACVFLMTAPRLVAHLFANIKDFPEMVFFTLALFAFESAWRRGSVPGLLGAGLVWGLALGTKANALFLPPIVAVVVLFARRPEAWRGRASALWSSLAGAGLLGGGLAFLLWPYLWPAPVERIGLHLEYIGLRLFATRGESVAAPLEALLLTTPLPFLLLALAGTYRCLLRIRQREAHDLLALAWVAVVLGRLHLPNAVNFDGVRHFLELFPALAVLAGHGTSWTSRRIATQLPARTGRWIASLFLVLVLLPGAVATVRIHPLQLAYWSSLAGGLEGARARGLPQAGDYWGTSYRLGMEWLNRHAAPHSALAVPVLQHTVSLVAPQRLRPDIGLLDITRPEVPDLRPGAFAILAEVAESRPLYVMFVPREDWTNALIEDCLRRLEPAAEWAVDGEPVLLIYRWAPPPAQS